jgi:hypothetical protein
MVRFINNITGQTKPSGRIIAGGVLARAIVAAWCCSCSFHGRGDVTEVTEIVMVWEYCVAIYFFCYIESGMV